MVTTSVAVNVACPSEEAATQWVGVVAFGVAREFLARHRKGDVIEAMGTLMRASFTDREGNERTSWSLVTEAILSAREARNEPARQREASASTRPRSRPPARSSYSAPRATGHRGDRVDDRWAEGGVP